MKAFTVAPSATVAWLICGQLEGGRVESVVRVSNPQESKGVISCVRVQMRWLPFGLLQAYVSTCTQRIWRGVW